MQAIRVVNEKANLFATHADEGAAIQRAEGTGYCMVQANVVKEIQYMPCEQVTQNRPSVRHPGEMPYLFLIG
jgi:hypothetical protein